MSVYQRPLSVEHFYITLIIWFLMFYKMQASVADNEETKEVMNISKSNESLTRLVRKITNGRPDIIFSSLATYSHNSFNDKRIVGGVEVDIEKYPYQVLIFLYDQTHCGGSIISKNFVLTAAHCLTGIWSVTWLRIKVGSSHSAKGGVLHDIRWMKIHPNFNHRKDFDVGVIRVKTPFKFGKRVQPVALVAPGARLPVGAKGVVTGWGQTQEWTPYTSQNLRMVKVPILSDRACLQAYGSLITDNMFCAGYRFGKRDSCIGDSGGPLVVRGTQIGIVSWGSGCARPNYPGVYTHLARLRRWVAQVTGV